MLADLAGHGARLLRRAPARSRRPPGSAPSHRDRVVDHLARKTYDYAYRGTGNWPFNTAYAATRTEQAFVTRFRSLVGVERLVAAGIPVVTSITFGRGQLDGAPISASNGHLLVVVGFTAAGDVVVNDPAAADNARVRRTYDRAQFENAWLKRGRGRRLRRGRLRGPRRRAPAAAARRGVKLVKRRTSPSGPGAGGDLAHGTHLGTVATATAACASTRRSARRRYPDPHRRRHPAPTTTRGRPGSRRWSRPGHGFTAVVPSWNARTPADSWLEVEAGSPPTALPGHAGTAGPLGGVGRRRSSRPRPTDQDDDHGHVRIEVLSAPGPGSAWTAYQLRLGLLRRRGRRRLVPRSRWSGVVAAGDRRGPARPRRAASPTASSCPCRPSPSRCTAVSTRSGTDGGEHLVLAHLDGHGAGHLGARARPRRSTPGSKPRLPRPVRRPRRPPRLRPRVRRRRQLVVQHRLRGAATAPRRS